MSPTLRATYRLQLTPAFGFGAARDLVPYLADLGISHLYLSPTLQARPGSTHGYDIIDPGQLSTDLGGEAGFRALAGTAAEAGLGIILDVVPNHLAADDANRYWATPELRDHFFDVDPVSGRWRRFFDIDELAAVRVEQEDVFEATHGKLLSLVSEGLVDGLRVDHPDGLADPRGYLERLRAHGVQRVWVEKILGVDEALPADWPVSGTVGYEFLNDLTALFVSPASVAALDELWLGVSGDARPFGAWALEAKLEQALGPFAPELERLGRVSMSDAAGVDVPGLAPGASGGTSTDALALALSCLPVYRTYTDPSAGEFITRFQQTSPAIMAKGVEDTAFYRFGRLLALNEVGGEPGRFHLPAAEFHAHNAARAAAHPEALLTTMTHDAKRSADVRARLVALTWFPELLRDLVERWLDHEGDGGPDPIERYFLLQTIVGVHPIEPDRLEGYIEKALREAKRTSSWVDQNTAHEQAVMAWTRSLLADAAFSSQLDATLAAIGPLAERINLGWIALKLTSPGVPDIYQGDELTFSALVDPDNRRPVDFALRQATLARVRAGGPAVGGWDSNPGHRKLKLIHDLLRLRARTPEAFGPGATYEPVTVADGGLAFIRGGEVLVHVAPATEDDQAPGAPEGWDPVTALAGLLVARRRPAG